MSKYKWYLKERHNPQFKNPYYVKLGKMSRVKAAKHTKPAYGTNILIPFDSEDLYNEKVSSLIKDGFQVHSTNTQTNIKPKK